MAIPLMRLCIVWWKFNSTEEVATGIIILVKSALRIAGGTNSPLYKISARI